MNTVLRRTTLTEARRKKGLSMMNLAVIVGTDKGYISHLEKGDRTPSLDMAKKICKALGCDWSVWDPEQPMCPNCGSLTEASAKRCWECGFDLNQNPERM